jgi:D-3-phosphoglycerate dehydrogenase
MVGVGLHINKDIIDRGKKLKIIATATTGVDHIDIPYAEKKGIKVMSLRGELGVLEKVTATAEVALGLMIALSRHIVPAAESVRKYEWDRESFEGNELSGKTLGLVGLGRLGTHVARYGKALLMDVIGYDPHVDEKKFHELGVKKVSFEELFQQSDVVSLHVNLTEKTEKLVGADALQHMKPSAILVNTSRGQIVDEDAVLKALQNKIIAGYATDVLANEINYHEHFTKDPLVEYAKKHTNCLIVPHIGGMAVEAAWKTRRCMVDKVIKELA